MFGALCTAVSGGYFTAGMLAEVTIGRPSSTFGIGCFYAPVIALGSGVIGFGLVALVDNKTGRKHPQWLHIKSPAIGLLFVLSLSVGVYLSAKAGYNNIKEFEELSMPQVVTRAKLLSKVFTLPFNTFQFQESLKTWDLSSESEDSFFSLIRWLTKQDKYTPIVWNDRQVTVVTKREKLVIRDKGTMIIADTDLSKYDYIRELWAIPIHLHAAEQDYLAVLADLRPSSHRSIIIIYDPTGSIVYQEILERKSLKVSIRKVTDTRTHEDAIEVNTHETFYLVESMGKK